MNASLEDIIEQFLEYCHLGNAPGIHTYAEQYPEHEKKLKELLPLLLQMEECGGSQGKKMMQGRFEMSEFHHADYRLLRKIGSGGMGVVFEALQVSFNRKVAVKILEISLLGNPTQRKMLENEAQVIAMLHHPNIVKVLSADCNSECCFYAMELIQGQGLDQCAVDGFREIARIALQAAKALAYAHSCHVLHRDIKPSNLLLDAQGELHVSDFGLAFILRTVDGVQEKVESQSGTLRYMAPERLAQGMNTFAGDQYSFGVTFYEIIAKAPIISEKDPKKLVDRITRIPLQPLSCAEEDLAAIINKCIQFNPQDRYASMDAVVEDLQHFLNHEPVVASKSSLIRRFRLWTKRKPAVAMLSFVGIVLLGALIIALTLGYVRTNSARRLAERNAINANATLLDVFSHMEHQIPTSGGSKLLSRLIPYFRDIAQQRKLSEEQIVNANIMVGTVAMRSGNYQIAEKSFRQAASMQPNAAVLTQLAEALRKQGKKTQADSIFS